jgi:DNA-binding NarL/FixJ family response regulator
MVPLVHGVWAEARTVKKHTSIIYGKLNASSLTQAVAQERERGLFSRG